MFTKKKKIRENLNISSCGGVLTKGLTQVKYANVVN